MLNGACFAMWFEWAFWVRVGNVEDALKGERARDVQRRLLRG